MFWKLITNIGDSALMLPSIIIIFLWLLDAKATRQAWTWLLLCAGAIGFVGLTKIAFLGWGYGIADLNFTGISGHTTLSVMVLTSATFLMVHRLSVRVQAVAGTVGFAVALLVAWSRLHLHVHSRSEVIAGIVLGSLVVWGFADCIQRRRLLRPRSGGYLALALILPLALLYGDRAPTEGLLTKVALELSGHPCPYSRSHPHELVCGRG